MCSRNELTEAAKTTMISVNGSAGLPVSDRMRSYHDKVTALAKKAKTG